MKDDFSSAGWWRGTYGTETIEVPWGDSFVKVASVGLVGTPRF